MSYFIPETMSAVAVSSIGIILGFIIGKVHGAQKARKHLKREFPFVIGNRES